MRFKDTMLALVAKTRPITRLGNGSIRLRAWHTEPHAIDAGPLDHHDDSGLPAHRRHPHKLLDSAHHQQPTPQPFDTPLPVPKFDRPWPDSSSSSATEPTTPWLAASTPILAWRMRPPVWLMPGAAAGRDQRRAALSWPAVRQRLPPRSRAIAFSLRTKTASDHTISAWCCQP